MKREFKVIALAGLLVSAALTAANGNSTDSRAATPVTFSKDVAPIFYANCVSCHRPGEIAPMSLMTFKDARPWARSIKEKVKDRVMPPWHADPGIGVFKNERRLSQKDVDTVVAWVEGGAKEGDSKDLPAAPKFSDGWQIGTPDVVLSMKDEFSVPAEGVISYQYFIVPTNFTEDKWVQAAEVRPGNRSVVHHVIVFIVGPEGRTQRGLGGRDGRIEGLVGTAPGGEPMILPDGIGKRIRAGSFLVLQMHYTPTGISQKDRTSIGLIFSRRPVEKALTGGAAMNRRFVIPAGDGSYEVRSSYTFKEDAHILNLMPHMHLRGKSFQYTLVYADGSSKLILSVPRYDFNWQERYELTTPLAAPKGSRLDCTAVFDNSSRNKFNPDPTKTIRWGPQTWDEMMIGFVGFTRDDEDLRKDVASAR